MLHGRSDARQICAMALVGEATSVIKGMAQLPPPKPVFKKRLMDPQSVRIYMLTKCLVRACAPGRQLILALATLLLRAQKVSCAWARSMEAQHAQSSGPVEVFAMRIRQRYILRSKLSVRSSI